MSIEDDFNRFDCECGATIYFTKINFMVKAWSKEHKPHMKKYLGPNGLAIIDKEIEESNARRRNENEQ
jgi:hypothetical protein